VQPSEDIGHYIKDRAWSHHASCTAAISADSDSNAVLDSNFRIRGVQNFHVVDASVFPRIPGVFIQAPIFMISEKAVDVILNGWENRVFFVVVMLSARRTNRYMLNEGSRKPARGFDSLTGKL
jgi:hypothetical protein